jgi:hypothetical protein
VIGTGRTFSLGRRGCFCEANHSPQSNSEVKSGGDFSHFPTFVYGVLLNKAGPGTKLLCASKGPPLWSSDQSSWLLTKRSWARFPVPPNFLLSSGSGTGSTQPRNDK